MTAGPATRQRLRVPAYPRRTAPAVALAVAAMLCVQTGAAISTWLFGKIGPVATGWLRLSWAALVLLTLTRPSLRARTPGELLAVLGLGAISGGMTLSYFMAIHLIPLGTATALEFLGPLTVAMVGLRRPLDLIWPLSAALGVLALTRPGTAHVNLVGLAFALGAAAGWGGYIVLTQRVGDRFPGLEGLALSMAAAALSTALVPGALRGLAHLTPRVVLVSAAAAVLLPILPYAFEMAALRRLNTASFGTLMSLEPAIGTVVGAAVLAQIPTALQLAGIGFVTLAGIGAAMRGRRPDRGLAAPARSVQFNGAGARRPQLPPSAAVIAVGDGSVAGR